MSSNGESGSETDQVLPRQDVSFWRELGRAYSQWSAEMARRTRYGKFRYVINNLIVLADIGPFLLFFGGFVALIRLTDWLARQLDEFVAFCLTPIVRFGRTCADRVKERLPEPPSYEVYKDDYR